METRFQGCNCPLQYLNEIAPILMRLCSSIILMIFCSSFFYAWEREKNSMKTRLWLYNQDSSFFVENNLTHVSDKFLDYSRPFRSLTWWRGKARMEKKLRLLRKACLFFTTFYKKDKDQNWLGWSYACTVNSLKVL